MNRIQMLRDYYKYKKNKCYKLDNKKANSLIEKGYAKLTLDNYLKKPISGIKNITTRAFGSKPNNK